MPHMGIRRPRAQAAGSRLRRGRAQLHPRVEGQSDGLGLKERGGTVAGSTTARPFLAGHKPGERCPPRTAGRVEDCAHSARASTTSPSRRPRRRLVLARRLGDGFGRSRGEPAPPGIGGRAVGLKGKGARGPTADGSTTAGTARFPVDHGGALERGRVGVAGRRATDSGARAGCCRLAAWGTMGQRRRTWPKG